MFLIQYVSSTVVWAIIFIIKLYKSVANTPKFVSFNCDFIYAIFCDDSENVPKN